MYIGRNPNTYNRSIYRFDITVDTTTISGAASQGGTLQYLPGPTVLVFLNGTLLVDTIDYLATNGTSITFNATLSAGDAVTIVAENAFNLAGSYTFAQSDSRYISSQINEVTVASGTTADIGSATSERIVMTGSSAVSSLGSVPFKRRIVRLAGNITFNYNGTSLLLPGGVPLYGLVGDILTFESDGSGNWRMTSFMGGNGRALSQFGNFKRQCACYGPNSQSFSFANSWGNPNFIPLTGSGFTFTTQNISTLTPLLVTGALGYSAIGPVDRIVNITSNFSWSLSASNAFYLYITLNADGTYTPGATTLAPIYQAGGTISTTSGQFTFDVESMTMYLGNGSTAVGGQCVVFLGQASTDGTGVTSAVCYRYNGVMRYKSTSGNLAGAGSNLAAIGHNMGTNFGLRVHFGIVCITANNGYSVGDMVVGIVGRDAGGAYMSPTIQILNNSLVTMNLLTPATTWNIVNTTTGTVQTLNAAQWGYNYVVERMW